MAEEDDVEQVRIGGFLEEEPIIKEKREYNSRLINLNITYTDTFRKMDNKNSL